MQMFVGKRNSDLQELTAFKGCYTGTVYGQGKQAFVPDLFAHDVTIDPLDSHVETGPVVARGKGKEVK